jgi:hypothetical protein
MIDQQLARLRTHRSNIQRYRNLLQTSLTELERKFVEQRLTEEQSNLESLTNSRPNDFRGSNTGASGNALFASGLTKRSNCDNATR